MNRSPLLPALILLSLLWLPLSACEQEHPPPSAVEMAAVQLEEDVPNKAYAALDLESLSEESRQLVEIALVLAEARKIIDADPSQREEVIAATGMDPDDIEDHVRRITQDPAALSVYIDGLQ